MRSRRAWSAAVGSLMFALLVTACDALGTAQTETPAAPPEPRELTSYVALGDSYAAGPFVPTTERETGCFRSTGNYPHLVADALGIEVTDVTCTGARTANLTAPQKTDKRRVPAQIEALDPDTDLVTLTFGRLDEGFSSGLAPAQALEAITRIGRNVIDALATIEETAPDALIVVVGYPHVVEEGRSCSERLPFTDLQVDGAAALEKELDLELRNAADLADAVFVDVYANSEGHGVCSRSPWVNGQATDRKRALAYHPLERGMRATADLVVEAINDELR